MRKIFPVCCASALAPHTVNATTIAKSPANFRFWILDFRLPEQESETRFVDKYFHAFTPPIENRQSKI